MHIIKIIIQVGQANILFKSIILQLYKRLKKTIEKKYSTNTRQCNLYLNSKKTKMTGNINIY